MKSSINKTKTLEVSLIILLTFTSIFFGFFTRPLFTQESSLVLHRNYLNISNDGEGWVTEGYFYPHADEIHLSLSARDKLKTLYHEFGHKYYRELDSNDRDWWDNMVCDTKSNVSVRAVGYECSEQFAKVMAEFMMIKSDYQSYSQNKTLYDFYDEENFFVFRVISQNWQELSDIYEKSVEE